MDVQEITKNLNPEQRTAVTHDAGPLLIVAGAGTGKTTVITQRIAWLILSGKAKPEEILAVTFTEKAAAEMAERVDQLLPYGYVDLWISTFHSLGEKLLKRHGLDIGLPNDFQVYDQTAQWLMVREQLEAFDLEYYKPLGNPTKFIHALLGHFSRAKDETVWPSDYLAYAKKIKPPVGKGKSKKPNSAMGEDVLEAGRVAEVARAYEVYQRLLLERNALDFGDLINYTVKLFTERPAILAQYRRQFKYILVDEFQDTNWAQYQLIKMLAAPANNITVVGDDDQAVYRFRGASISNILEFRTDYPAAAQVVLTTNYRSRQEILDAAHGFIQHNNPNRLECRLQDDAALVGQAKKRGVSVAKWQAIDKRLSAHAGTGATIEHLHFATVAQEVDGVIQKIIDLKRTDAELRWSDFAILVRANAHARPFIAALTRLRLPFYFVALRGLYSKESILDVLAYFRLLDNYHESPALWRVLNFPTSKLTDADRIALTHHAKYRGCSLYEALTRAAVDGVVGSAALAEIDRLLSQVTTHTRLAQEKAVSELFVTIFTDLGYFQYLKDHEDTSGRTELDYLRQWYRKIREFEEITDEPRLKNFMARINLEIESGEEGGLQFDVEAGPETIRIMTIHAAKGLEFQHVFIVNVVQQRFPTAERSEPIALPDELIKEVVPEGDIHLQEERRLMYVAMTRAKAGLYFTSASDYGGTRAKKLSRFLDELGYGGAVEQPAAIKDVIDRPAMTMPVAPTPLAVPKKFAYSQLSSYNKCPLQYKYAYVLKIPTFGKPSFSFGNTIHGTLQKFFELLLPREPVIAGKQQANLFAPPVAKKAAWPSLATLLKIYDEKWIDAWYENPKQKQAYYEKGKQLLTEYHRVLAKDRPRPIALEQPFTIKVGGYSVGGRIDRIDATADGVEIVDYKTGQAKATIKDDDKDQLLIYQLAAEETLGYTPQRLTYYYIEEGKPMSFLGSEQDKEKIKEKITATIGKIKTGDFTPTPGWVCGYCDFKDICSFRDPNA